MGSLLLASLTLSTTALAASGSPTMATDLAHIGHVNSKGRVQDQALPVIEAFIQSGPAAIPKLVRALEDDTPIEGQVFDFWPEVRVGDVAFVVLCDFFTMSDWKTSTIPGLDWDVILDRGSAEVPAWDLLGAFLARHGRSGLRQRIESLLKPYEGQIVWDSTERCFRPN